MPDFEAVGCLQEAIARISKKKLSSGSWPVHRCCRFPKELQHDQMCIQLQPEIGMTQTVDCAEQLAKGTHLDSKIASHIRDALDTGFESSWATN